MHSLITNLCQPGAGLCTVVIDVTRHCLLGVPIRSMCMSVIIHSRKSVGTCVTNLGYRRCVVVFLVLQNQCWPAIDACAAVSASRCSRLGFLLRKKSKAWEVSLFESVCVTA
jgi:hypothetical protein